MAPSKNPYYSIFLSLLYGVIFLSSIFVLKWIPGLNLFNFSLSSQEIILLLIVCTTSGYIVILLLNEITIKRNIRYISKELSKDNSELTNIDELKEQITATQEQKDLEILLLKDREQYRREFLGNVTHELKTPLFSIQGYTLTLLEGGIDDPKLLEKYLGRINKLTDRLIYIVNDLDTLSELEQQNLQLNKESFDFKVLVQGVFDLLEYKAQNNKVKLVCDAKTSKNIVFADYQRIEQVMVNLLVNAISYAGEGSTATVELSDANHLLKIKVIDNGQGIPPEHHQRIFERFYRIDAHRSRKNGGSGLGLSIVKHILEAHGQKIFLESEVGKGTTFTFYLPRG